MPWPRWIRTGWRMAAVALGLMVAMSVSAHADELDALNQRLLELFQSGQYPEAIAAAERAEAGTMARFSDTHPEYAKAMGRHGHALLIVKRYAEAEPLFKRALEIATAALPPDHPGLAEALDGLGSLYQWQGRVREAEPLLRKALAIRENSFTADDPGLLDTVVELSNAYFSLSLPDEDDRLLPRAIGLVESKLGFEHPYLAPLLIHYSMRRMLRDGTTAGDELKARSAALLESAIEGGRLDATTSLVNGPMMAALADLVWRLNNENKLDEAGRAADLMREMRVKAVNANHAYQVAFGTAAAAQLSVYELQHRFPEYETVASHNIEALEKYIPHQPDMSAPLSAACEKFAAYHEKRKNFTQAEVYYKRAVALREAGSNPLEAVEALAGGKLIGGSRMPEGMASFYEKQGKFADGEEALTRALAVREKHQGAEHAEVKELRRRLAQWRAKHNAPQGQPHVAEKPAPAAPNANASVKTNAGNAAPGCSDLLALLDDWEARKAEARKSCSGAVSFRLDASAAMLKAAGSSEIGLSEYASLAQEPFEKGDWTNAVALLSRGVDVTTALSRRTGYRSRSTAVLWLDADRHPVSQPLMLVKAAYRLAATDTSREPELLQTAFIAAQHEQWPAAAVAIGPLTARQASGDPALARLMRERQDLIGERLKLDLQLVSALRQSSQNRNSPGEEQRRVRTEAINSRLTEIDKTVAKDFPDYAAFANPDPLNVAETQALLGSDEALVMLADTPQLGPGSSPEGAIPAETYIWVIARTGARWLKADIGGKALAEAILALRCGLDDGNWSTGSEQRDRCVEILHQEVPEGRLPPFDLGRSYSLYSALFGKAGDLIANKRLLVAPTGPFTSLPLQALVTQKPGVSIPAKPEGYGDAKWFGAEHAITVLPTVASLKALRARVKPSAADRPFVGFGNPLLEGAPDEPGGRAMSRQKQSCQAEAVAGAIRHRYKGLAQTPLATALFHGGSVDLSALRRVAPLPKPPMRCVRWGTVSAPRRTTSGSASA